MAPGDDLIEPHIEARDGRGHEELYFVVRGAARFALDGEGFDAPAGTFVFVQPEVHRHAAALAGCEHEARTALAQAITLEPRLAAEAEADGLASA